MKKTIILAVTLIMTVIMLANINSKELDVIGNKEFNNKLSNEIRGIYISYIEYQKYFDNKNEEEIKLEINKMIENIYDNRFNLIILHVRPFSDAIYDSNIYPYSYTVSGKEGIKKLDVLDYFVEKSHELDIQVHAWINPYRIRNTTDIKNISIGNPCYKWLGTDKVKIIKDKGIFYNPSSNEVEELIVNGVEEIVKNYNVDGIHFDDYFYPSDDIDNNNYQKYIASGGNLTLKEYRYNIINNMIKNVYSTIKKIDKNIIFSIAPDANIDNNYNYNMADIFTWLDNDNYVDYIIPQIYYGFNNSNKPYVRTLIEWNNYIKNDHIKLIPALAFYKIGKIDSYAGIGKNEWLNSKNIIANQIKASRNMDKYNGFVLFRYDSYFNNSEIVSSERKEFLKMVDLTF